MDLSGVVAVAKGQHGLITTEQLQLAGFDAHAIRWARRSGKLLRFLPRVHLLAGAQVTWETRALGGLLVAGPESVLSHDSAALLYRLRGFGPRRVGPIHLTVPSTLNPRLPSEEDADDSLLSGSFVVHRTKRSFTPWEREKFRVTRLGRTFLDLAATTDEERLEIALDSAQQGWRRLPEWLDSELASLDVRAPGVSMLRSLLAVRTGPAAESEHETLIRRRLRSRNIVPPVHQLVIYDARGNRILRADEAWPGHKVIVHGHSFQWHGDRKAFDADAAILSRLAAEGWLSFMVTSTSLKDDAWLDQLERALALRAPQLDLFRARDS
jgi:hypothetical protein